MVIYIDETGESQIRSKFKSNIVSELPESTDNVSSLISTLQKQLEEKDKQIADLMLALQREQTLHAGTQTQLLTDGKEKVSLWSKLFKRK